VVAANLTRDEARDRAALISGVSYQVELDLTGPRESDLDVTVKGGVGQATIRLPRDVGVRAHAAGGIGSIDAEGLKKDGSDYTNEMWGKTPHKITLDVQGGIGSIELVQE